MTRQGITVLGLAAMLLGLTACGKQAGIAQCDASYVASFYDIPDTVTGISRLLIKSIAASPRTVMPCLVIFIFNFCLLF